MFGLSKVKFFVLLAIIVVVVASASAFAAGITMPDKIAAGQGVSTITGFSISDLKFTWDTANPAKMTAVAFTLTAADGDPVAEWANVTVDEVTTKCALPTVTDDAAAFVCTPSLAVDAADVASVTVAGGSDKAENPVP
jgi:hypothetical protein